jgi:hypothetical protein
MLQDSTSVGRDGPFRPVAAKRPCPARGIHVSVTIADPAAGAYLELLTERTRTLLGPDLVGVYAGGSIALDAYQPGRSDIDVAIVCAHALDVATKRAIIAELRTESLPCPARGLELVVYRTEVAEAATAEPGFEVELNSGPHMPFRATFAGADRSAADGTFWYAIDRSILAERGHCLSGPPASAVFRSVSDANLVTLLVASLRWHLGAVADATTAGGSVTVVQDSEESAAWTDDAVLNACRAWQRVRSGHWLGKVEAGRRMLDSSAPSGGWVTANEVTPSQVALGQVASSKVPPSKVTVSRLTPTVTATVRQALDARVGGSPPSVRDAREFQRFVLAALEQELLEDLLELDQLELRAPD